MFLWVSELNLAELSWLSIIAFVLYYLEKRPRYRRWLQEIEPGAAPAKHIRAWKVMNFEHGLIFLILSLNIVLINKFPDDPNMTMAVLGSGIGFVAGTISLAVSTMRPGIYSPGVVSASLLFPLVPLVYFWKVSQLGLLTPFLLFNALVPGLIIIPIYMGLKQKFLLSKG